MRTMSSSLPLALTLTLASYSLTNFIFKQLLNIGYDEGKDKTANTSSHSKKGQSICETDSLSIKEVKASYLL